MRVPSTKTDQTCNRMGTKYGALEAKLNSLNPWITHTCTEKVVYSMFIWVAFYYSVLLCSLSETTPWPRWNTTGRKIRLWVLLPLSLSYTGIYQDISSYLSKPILAVILNVYFCSQQFATLGALIIPISYALSFHITGNIESAVVGATAVLCGRF